MSDELPVKYEPTKGFLADFKASVAKAENTESELSTDPDRIGHDMMELLACIKYVQTITEQFRDPKSKLSKEDRNKFYLSANLVSQVGTMTGLLIVAKCLGFREPVILENDDGTEEPGFDHIAVAEMLNVLVNMAGSVNNSTSSTMQMLHALSIEYKDDIFTLKDKNGQVICKDMFNMDPAQQKAVKAHLRRVSKAKGISRSKVMMPTMTIDDILEEEGDADDSE